MSGVQQRSYSHAWDTQTLTTGPCTHRLDCLDVEGGEGGGALTRTPSPSVVTLQRIARREEAREGGGSGCIKTPQASEGWCIQRENRPGESERSTGRRVVLLGGICWDSDEIVIVFAQEPLTALQGTVALLRGRAHLNAAMLVSSETENGFFCVRSEPRIKGGRS